MQTIDEKETIETRDGEIIAKEEAVILTLGESAGEWVEADNIELIEHEGEAWLNGEDQDDYVIDHRGAWIDSGDAVWLTLGESRDEYAESGETIQENGEAWLESEEPTDRWGDVIYVQDIDGDWIARDDAVWSEHHSEYLSEGCAEYCEHCEGWFIQGHSDVEHSLNESSDHVNNYHCSPGPRIMGRRHGARFQVGFEVEKTETGGATSEGDYIGENDLFAGWESDSSCGIEGITHVYGLSEEGRMEFETDCENAEELLGGSVDPSCGGHVNLSRVDGEPLTITEIRPYAPLVYALYRFRLTKRYCDKDKPLKGGGREKYCAIRVKSGGIVEFRLVAAVKNSAQLQWRFRLFQEIAYAIENALSFRGFMRRCRPLLREVYAPEKREKIRALSHDFRAYLEKGVIRPAISQFI